MKREVRGTLTGFAGFFGALGITVYVLFGGIVFDKIAPWAPFALVASADALVFVIALIFIGFGLLKKSD